MAFSHYVISYTSINSQYHIVVNTPSRPLSIRSLTILAIVVAIIEPQLALALVTARLPRPHWLGYACQLDCHNTIISFILPIIRLRLLPSIPPLQPFRHVIGGHRNNNSYAGWVNIIGSRHVAACLAIVFWLAITE